MARWAAVAMVAIVALIVVIEVSTSSHHHAQRRSPTSAQQAAGLEGARLGQARHARAAALSPSGGGAQNASGPEQTASGATSIVEVSTSGATQQQTVHGPAAVVNASTAGSSGPTSSSGQPQKTEPHPAPPPRQIGQGGPTCGTFCQEAGGGGGKGGKAPWLVILQQVLVLGVHDIVGVLVKCGLSQGCVGAMILSAKLPGHAHYSHLGRDDLRVGGDKTGVVLVRISARASRAIRRVHSITGVVALAQLANAPNGYYVSANEHLTIESGHDSRGGAKVATSSEASDRSVAGAQTRTFQRRLGSSSSPTSVSVSGGGRTSDR